MWVQNYFGGPLFMRFFTVLPTHLPHSIVCVLKRVTKWAMANIVK